MKTAVIPGSFDPPTAGHLSIIARASRCFERVIVLVMSNPSKARRVSFEARARLLRSMTRRIENVEIDTAEGLLADYMKRYPGALIVKGVRTAADFEYERQMAEINRRLCGAETLFLPCEEGLSYVSSSAVRELAALGGDLSGFVPGETMAEIKELYGKERGGLS